MTDEQASPKVSVVIPTYNRASLVGEAMRSVLAQTFPDFELIVVDDGSTDDTRSVVAGFKDSRIRYVPQDNMGISGARNTGIRNARGRYVAFLDSDDLWLPQLLEVEVHILDHNPEAGVVYAKAQGIGSDGNLTFESRGYVQKYSGQTLKSMLYADFTCIQTSLVRRQCFERAGLFDESLTGRVDWDMFLRLAQHCDFAHVDRVLAHFRTHAQQFTGPASTQFAEVVEAGVTVLDKAFSAAGLPREVMAIKPVAYRNLFTDIGLRWLSISAWRQSAHCFWRAIRVSPCPLTTLFRIAGLVVLYRVLNTTAWGSRLVSNVVEARFRRRATPPHNSVHAR
jgi:glycosyltransferase involved in cell wall biosynthesis